MLGKLGLANIEPERPYLSSATGPLSGARLLFTGTVANSVKPAELDKWVMELDEMLKLGMQVLEDSLCNWQKSPDRFLRFRG